jgi:hypothetical protein
VRRQQAAADAATREEGEAEITEEACRGETEGDAAEWEEEARAETEEERKQRVEEERTEERRRSADSQLRGFTPTRRSMRELPANEEIFRFLGFSRRVSKELLGSILGRKWFSEGAVDFLISEFYRQGVNSERIGEEV